MASDSDDFVTRPDAGHHGGPLDPFCLCSVLHGVALWPAQSSGGGVGGP